MTPPGSGSSGAGPWAGPSVGRAVVRDARRRVEAGAARLASLAIGEAILPSPVGNGIVDEVEAGGVLGDAASW